MNIEQTKRVTANVIKHHTARIDIQLLALNWITDEKRKEYYSSLDKDDLAHNMDTLFSELITIHSVIHEEMELLLEYRIKLVDKDNTHAQ